MRTAKCLRCGAGSEWLQGNPPPEMEPLIELLALADALADAVEAEWFVWDDSGDHKPSGYCQHCGASMHATMWETTQDFIKSQITDKHEPTCLVMKARAYRSARRPAAGG